MSTRDEVLDQFFCKHSAISRQPSANQREIVNKLGGASTAA
ncbi:MULTISPECIES: hypothetical protein [Moorena]|nr:MULTISPECIES: hypothetical protein [Moorena]